MTLLKVRHQRELQEIQDLYDDYREDGEIAMVMLLEELNEIPFDSSISEERRREIRDLARMTHWLRRERLIVTPRRVSRDSTQNSQRRA